MVGIDQYHTFKWERKYIRINGIEAIILCRIESNEWFGKFTGLNTKTVYANNEKKVARKLLLQNPKLRK